MPTAAEIASRFVSPRCARIQRLRRYSEGTQYDGRHPFLQESDDAPPLLERAPCIVYPIVANSIRSHADFVLGEGRFPALHPRGLTEDQEATATTQLAEVADESRLQVAAREAFEASLCIGTVATVCGFRDQLFAEELEPEWCAPTFAPDGSVASIEILYPYEDTFFNEAAGKYDVRCMLFRRVIDAVNDITYKPQSAPESGQAPKAWTEDVKVSHGLGFCPVHWYTPLRRQRKAGQIDGIALADHALDEVDALNFALSQRHRAALFCGDPLRWESGVDPSNVPGSGGRDAHVAVEVTQDARGPHPKGTFKLAARPGKTRKVGASAIWSSENPDYKVGMLSLPGDALAAITEHADDLKAKLHETFGVVDLDIENAKIASDMSGKAQAIARQRQVDRDNLYRQDFGDRWLIPVVRMLLKIAAKKGRAFSFDPATVRIDLAWGPYFQSTAADQKATVDLVAASLAAKLITRRIGIEKLKSEGVFAIDSADAVASEPTLEDALQVGQASVGSETFDRIYKLRLALALLGNVDSKDASAIEAEIEEAAAMSAERRASPPVVQPTQQASSVDTNEDPNAEAA